MINRLIITDEGARFTLYQSEYLGFDDVAEKTYSDKLRNLTIGKAADLLRVIAVASLIELSESAPDAPEAIDAELGALATETDLMHSIKTTGRILIEVMANDHVGQVDAQPIQTLEIIGDAWRRNHPTINE